MIQLLQPYKRSSFERNFPITYHLLPNKKDSLSKVVIKITFTVFTGFLVPFFSLMYEVSRNLYLYKSIYAPKTKIEKFSSFVKENEAICNIVLSIAISNICPQPIRFVIQKVIPVSWLQNDLLKVIDFVNWPSSQLTNFGQWLGSFPGYVSNTVFLVPRIILHIVPSSYNIEVIAFRSLIQGIINTVI